MNAEIKKIADELYDSARHDNCGLRATMEQIAYRLAAIDTRLEMPKAERRALLDLVEHHEAYGEDERILNAAHAWLRANVKEGA